jgi:CheY-like chemotaxis protein
MRAGRFVMDCASSGGQAIDRIREAEEGSLILLFSDINMSGMSGLELFPRVKAMLPNLLVIMITAYGDAGTLRRAKESGAHGIYDKPIDFAALKVEIDQRLAARGLPA